MVSYIKKSLASMVGYGDPKYLPPADFIVDNEEGDCSTCEDPCSEHRQFPSYLYIEQDFPMLGSVKPYGRHIIIATGKSDWPHRIERVKGTLANSLYNAQQRLGWKNLITNSSLISIYSTVPNSCDVMVFPDNIIVSNVTCESASDFYALFIGVPLPKPTEKIDIPFMMKDERIGDMTIHTNPYKTMLMLCSHGKTDKRCGVTAPLLSQELNRVLIDKDLDEYDAGIIMVSHIGGNTHSLSQRSKIIYSTYQVETGHQIAGNVICYVNEGKRGIWYGRVKTCHCESIVQETIVHSKVIKELYRGCMDNSFENQVQRSFLRW